MSMLQITSALMTHRGMRRKHNEDAVGYEYPSDVARLQADGVLFIVADGVGGLAAGERASQMAVDQLKQHYFNSDTALSLEERLAWAVQQTNTDVHTRLDKKAATTLVAVIIRDTELVAASVGDSVIFLVRDDNLEQLNEADTLPDAQTEEERSVLTKAIGYQEMVDVQTISGTLQVGDRLLLCSDGLTRFVGEEILLRLSNSRDPRGGVRRMVSEANKAGGGDNISAVLVLLDEPQSAEEVLAHLQATSALVALDNVPMVTPDVPTKPNTMVPQSRPEPVAQVLDDLVEPPRPAAQPIVPPVTSQTASPAAVEQPRRFNPLMIGGIVVLIVGAFILGGALFSQNSASSLPPTRPASDPTGVSPDTSITGNEGLQQGSIIRLEVAVVTRVSVGDSAEAGGSFVTDPSTQYLIETIFEDGEGQLWYRLQDDTNSQNGWLPEDDLPAYELISSP